MWTLVENVDSYRNLLSEFPSKYYSDPVFLESSDQSSLVEFSNSLLHVHTDRFWSSHPPSILYLYCESSAESGGESLIGCFDNISFTEQQLNFMANFEFSIKKYNSSHTFNILENGIYRFNHSHADMMNQVTDLVEKELFSQIILKLKKHSNIVSLKSKQGLIINNHRCFHGRLAFIGRRSLVKVHGYDAI